MRASPATTIMRPIVPARRTLARWTASPMPSSFWTGRWTIRPTLAGNLRDLRRINRWLGGVRLSADAIDALAAHRDSLTVLDVGTGGADIPMALLARAGKRGRGLSIVGIDSRPEVLTAAVMATPAVAATSGLELHVGDGRSLPYGDGSFDVVHSSLLIHHLSAREAVVLLREMARVARLGVVVNDLDRTRLGWIGAVADRPPPDPEPIHAHRRSALGPALVSAPSRPGAAAGRRPDAGADDPWLVRPAIRDRRRPDAGVADRATARAAGPAGRRRVTGRQRAGRHRDRRWRPGRGGPRRPTRRGGSRGRRSWSGRPPGPGGPAGVFTSPAAVGRAAASRPGRGDARRRRAADPGDARRDPLGHDVPPDLRHRDRRRARRRVRSIPARPGSPRSGGQRGRRRPSRLARDGFRHADRHARRARPRRPADHHPRRRSSSARTACIRSWRGGPVSRGRPGSIRASA